MVNLPSIGYIHRAHGFSRFEETTLKPPSVGTESRILMTTPGTEVWSREQDLKIGSSDQASSDKCWALQSLVDAGQGNCSQLSGGTVGWNQTRTEPNSKLWSNITPGYVIPPRKVRAFHMTLNAKAGALNIIVAEIFVHLLARHSAVRTCLVQNVI